jgi:lipoyl(octanoyl) transferase
LRHDRERDAAPLFIRREAGYKNHVVRFYNYDMTRSNANEAKAPTAEFHLLGQVTLEDGLTIQRRLVFEAGENRDPRIVVLLCEHPEVITVGRAGSRADIRLSHDELRERKIDVRWLGRGGGCIVHSPGQLAIYPIVPLVNVGWTVGEYLRRLQSGLASALSGLDVAVQSRPGRFGVWGRTGQLAAVGAAVQYDVAWQGAFVNVNPESRAVGYVETNPARWRKGPTLALAAPDKPEMSSLLAERGRPVKMTQVRTGLIEALSAAWGCRQYHLWTGHPLLTAYLVKDREPSARAS